MVMFEVELHGGGSLLKRFVVPAYDTKGLIPIPRFDALAARLGKRQAEALQRGTWEIAQPCHDVLRLDMCDKAGKPLGSLFARKAGRRA